MEISYYHQDLILLPYSHQPSKLYAEHVHNKDHLGIASAASKIRLRFEITNGFLIVLRKFMSLRGYLSKLRSDTDSQLVAANKELKAVIKGIDSNKLKEFGAENGFDWDFFFT